MSQPAPTPRPAWIVQTTPARDRWAQAASGCVAVATVFLLAVAALLGLRASLAKGGSIQPARNQRPFGNAPVPGTQTPPG